MHVYTAVVRRTVLRILPIVTVFQDSSGKCGFHASLSSRRQYCWTARCAPSPPYISLDWRCLCIVCNSKKNNNNI